MAPTRPLKLLVLTAATMAAALLVFLLSPRAVPWLPNGFTSPTLALEFVESSAQFTSIVEQRTMVPDGQYASTLFWYATLADLLLIATYGLLWVALFTSVEPPDRRRLVRRLGAALVLLAVVADCVEDFGIIRGLGSPDAPAALIRSAAGLKWGALGIAFLALCWRFFPARGSSPAPRIAGLTISGAYAYAGVLCLLGVTRSPLQIEAVAAPLSVGLLGQLAFFVWVWRQRLAPDPASFTEKLDEVREVELGYIARRRQRWGEPLPNTEEVSKTLVGLAMSGGGIRSATTNLGIVQALSRMGVLPLVDYVCTVSGGGYLGACLTSLLSVPASVRLGEPSPFTYERRENLAFDTNWPRFPFNPELPPSPGPDCAPQAFDTRGKQIVAHLRTHGSFLIARRGLFKRDALRAVGHLLTGTVYHLLTTLLVFVVATVALMGLAHALEPDLHAVLTAEVKAASHEVAAVRPVGSPGPGYSVTQRDEVAWSRQLSDRFSRTWDGITYDFLGTRLYLALVWGGAASVAVLVLFAAATRWLWPLPWPATWKAGESREDRFDRILVNISMALVALAAVLVCTLLPGQQRDGHIGWIAGPVLVLLGARVASFLLYPLVTRADGTRLGGLNLWTRQFRSLWGSYQAITTYGLTAVLLFTCLPIVAYAVVATMDAGSSLWSLLAPGVSLVTGRVLVGRADKPGGARFTLPAGARNFVLGLVVVVVVGFAVVAAAALLVRYDLVPGHTTLRFWMAAILSGGTLVFLSLVGDINKISPHYFYRDRLIETYLRTEVPGLGNRMETFTDTMEMPLTSLQGDDPAPGSLGNTAPYLLISAAVNLAGSRDLTRKDRKSAHFLFSKYFCGSRQTGYRRTEAYRDGRTKLGRAITISGAAASTAIGYHTFFAQSFLTAIFNLRLGYWISNPRANAGDALVFWPRYMLHEVFSSTSERTPLVNLSDGGHTGDNVGLYPLLERRCQVIIACDAEADAALSFGSFTEAIRQAYVDLGVDVDIDLSMIRPDPQTGLSQSHCAVGRIRYPECPTRPNWLIYLKNSLTGDEPAPVMNYRSRCPEFRHETTADQFFDDAQFESYRALGVHIAEDTFATWAGDPAIAGALRAGR